MATAGDKQDVQAQLQLLRERYSEALPQRLAGLNECWQQLCRDGWSGALAETLLRELHSLAGGAPTFGYPELGQTARALEYQLQQWLDQGGLPQREECDGFRGRLQSLAHLASIAPVQSGPLPRVQSDPAPGRAGRLVCLYSEPQAETLARLIEPLQHFGYQARVLPDVQALAEAVDRELPLALVCGADTGSADTPLMQWLQRFQADRAAPVPVIFIARDGGFEARLQAVRVGGYAYLPPPLEISELVERLDGLTAESGQAPYRVLLVDDDVALAQHYALVLEEAGMTVELVHAPEGLLERLEAFRPDLVLMDLYLPTCTGIELARVIRQDRSYVGMPIVFLSTETDVERQLEALYTGGDDFLTKPIGDLHLVSAVRSRARRSRVLDSVVSRDSLTGLLKHTRIKEVLETELERARRSGRPLAVAMIDLDRFKAVNDTHGHQRGDAVLKSLGRLLRERLRSGDSAGRYGGEEFLAILPDTDAEGALKVLEDIRRDFAGIEYESGTSGQVFRVTLSAGVAVCPDCPDATQLTEAADRALYRAKENGRDRVELAQDL